MPIQKKKLRAVMLAGIAAGGAGVALALAVAAASVQNGSTITVRAGDDLQSALNSATSGDVIRLEAGATFTGTFELPAKSGSQPVSIRTENAERWLPGANDRVGPEHARFMATIKARDGQPALRTAPGADHWRIFGVQFEGSGGNDVILLGDGSRAQSNYDSVPEDLVLDRVLVRGDSERGQKRGIALNSGETTIKNSYIWDIKARALETQAIAGWNGPGPYLIENNYVEAAGINVLFGGAAPSIGSLVPSDITVRRNHFSKDLGWRNGPWTVKNLFELKNARRVLIEGNLFEHNWVAAQGGYAILFTVRNPGSQAPWSAVEEVTFRHNVVRRVSAGINVLGFDSNPTRQTRAIVIRNNLFEEVDHRKWTGNGTFLQLGDEPADIIVQHNTVLQTGNAITAYGGTRAAPRPIRGLRFIDNIVFHNTYGITGSGFGTGNPAIERYFPDAEIVNNIIAGGQSQRYPAGNFFPTAEELMEQFVSVSGADYRLAPSSSLRRSASDESDPGVNFTELYRVMGGRPAR